MLEEVKQICPFGPQMVDSTYTTTRKVCLVWCSAFVCYLVKTQCNKDKVQGLGGWITGLVENLGLQVPKNVSEAFAYSQSYFTRIRKYGQDIVATSKLAPPPPQGWPEKGKKRKREGPNGNGIHIHPIQPINVDAITTLIDV